MSFSQFECIGLSAKTDSKVIDLINKTIEKAKTVQIPNAKTEHYKVFNDGKAQIWYLFKDNELLSAHPHFQADNKPRVSIVNYVIDEENATGRLIAYLKPTEDLQNGLAPIVFNVPDFWLIDEMQFPFAANIELAGFAININLFSDVDEFFAKTETLQDLKLSDKALIPTGLFVEENQKPEPLVLMSGHIISSEKIYSVETGQDYYHLNIESIENIDILAPAYAFKSEPKQGMIVLGDFYLSGRLV